MVTGGGFIITGGGGSMDERRVPHSPCIDGRPLGLICGTHQRPPHPSGFPRCEPAGRPIVSRQTEHSREPIGSQSGANRETERSRDGSQSGAKGRRNVPATGSVL
eukprot:1175601-Prorocentrum_minimum.AAC.5